MKERFVKASMPWRIELEKQDQNVELRVEKIPKPILRKAANIGKMRAVRCLETGVVYKNSTQAADLLSADGKIVCPRGILNNCQGKQKSAGGFHWEYA